MRGRKIYLDSFGTRSRVNILVYLSVTPEREYPTSCRILNRQFLGEGQTTAAHINGPRRVSLPVCGSPRRKRSFSKKSTLFTEEKNRDPSVLFFVFPDSGGLGVEGDTHTQRERERESRWANERKIDKRAMVVSRPTVGLYLYAIYIS